MFKSLALAFHHLVIAPTLMEFTYKILKTWLSIAAHLLVVSIIIIYSLASIYNFTLPDYKPITAVKGTWIDGESLNDVLHLFIIGYDVSSLGQLTYFLFEQRLGCYLLQVRGDIARALMYMAVCYGFQQPRGIPGLRLSDAPNVGRFNT